MTRIVSALLAFALLAPSAASAQPAMPPAGAAGAPSPEAQAMMMQAMQLQQQLQQLQQEALKDPAIAKERATFEAMVEKKMTKLDPKAAKWIAEMKALMKEGEALQKKGDFAGLQALGQKAQPIGMKLQGLQVRLTKDKEVETAAAALEIKVRAKMTSLNPKVGEMETQLRGLAEKMRPPAGGLKMPAPKK